MLLPSPLRSALEGPLKETIVYPTLKNGFFFALLDSIQTYQKKLKLIGADNYNWGTRQHRHNTSSNLFLRNGFRRNLL